MLKISAFCFLLALAPATAQAGGSFRLSIGLPIVPPLVVVAPGIQVVEGCPEELFLMGGWYWCRRPDGWYRARSPRARFGWVEARFVPMGLVRMPLGQYRNWHHAEERRAERHEFRREEGRGREGRRRER